MTILAASLQSVRYKEEAMEREYAILMDMDGVLMETRNIKAKVCKTNFDKFLSNVDQARYGKQKEFDLIGDFSKFIDGKTLHDGVQSFLLSRNINLSEVELGYLADTIRDSYRSMIGSSGPEVYSDSLRALRKWTVEHVPVGVVSNSELCKSILQRARMELYFDTIIDPDIARMASLKGKPEPDYYLHAAQLIGFEPKDCIVVEDSEAGVLAAKRGGFNTVYGIVHDNQDERVSALKSVGADRIINSLEQLNPIH